MAFLASLSGGAGGITGGDQRATSGNADLQAATGDKTINIGGNPNVQTALQSPVFIIGAAVALIAVVYLWRRR